MRKSLNKLEMMQSSVDMVMKLGKDRALRMLRKTVKIMSNPKNESVMRDYGCVFCNTYKDANDCKGCPYAQWENNTDLLDVGCLQVKYKAFKNGFEYSKQRAKDYKFMLEFTKEL